MATTLVLGAETDLTLSATALNVEAVTIPVNARWLRMYFRSATGYFQSAGTDGAARGSGYSTIPADIVFWRSVLGVQGQARNLESAVVYLSAANNSVVVELTATRDRG
jgi:hypothetical protein